MMGLITIKPGPVLRIIEYGELPVGHLFKGLSGLGIKVRDSTNTQTGPHAVWLTRYEETVEPHVSRPWVRIPVYDYGPVNFKEVDRGNTRGANVAS